MDERTYTGGPGTTSNASAVYHAPAGGVVLYGGRQIFLHTDMWAWNGSDWT